MGIALDTGHYLTGYSYPYVNTLSLEEHLENSCVDRIPCH